MILHVPLDICSYLLQGMPLPAPPIRARLCTANLLHLLHKLRPRNDIHRSRLSVTAYRRCMTVEVSTNDGWRISWSIRLRRFGMAIFGNFLGLRRSTCLHLRVPQSALGQGEEPRCNLFGFSLTSTEEILFPRSITGICTVEASKRLHFVLVLIAYPCASSNSSIDRKPTEQEWQKHKQALRRSSAGSSSF